MPELTQLSAAPSGLQGTDQILVVRGTSTVLLECTVADLLNYVIANLGKSVASTQPSTVGTLYKNGSFVGISE